MSYTTDFYRQIASGARLSAEIVVPRLDELFHPESVLDVGCGQGWWAAEFDRRGVAVHAIDGPHVDVEDLAIPSGRFEAVDLTQWEADGDYDLAVCLEVAEHLPEPAGANLVHQLTWSAPFVVFSAAVPGQSGVDHVNLQWPQYWVDLFAVEGYVASDQLRWEFWDHPQVENWYRQNLLVFADEQYADHVPLDWVDSVPAVIHPERWPG